MDATTLSANLIESLESDIDVLNPSEICTLASCSYYLKCTLEKPNDMQEDTYDITFNEYEKLRQTLENVSFTNKDFSMEQMKNVLTFECPAISSHVSNSAIEFLKTKNKPLQAPTSTNPQKRLFGIINTDNDLGNSDLGHPEPLFSYQDKIQLAFDNGWIQELLLFEEE